MAHFLHFYLLSSEPKLFFISVSLQLYIYRPIYHVKFAYSHGDRMEYNGSQGTDGRG